MPNFSSPLGTKELQSQPMREYDVMDPTIDMNAINEFQNKPYDEDSIQKSIEEEKKLRAAREARKSGKEPLTDGAKRRIEMLIGMTRSTREVDINGNMFAFQTLRSKEMREAIMAAAEFDGTVQSPFEIRRQLLGRSLTHVANVDVERFINSNTLEARLQLIDNLDEPLLNRLYDEYLKLTNEAKDKFAIKTETDVKEVSEDLKK